MTERIYEGTWEEVATHAPEFIGRRVRLVVLEEAEHLEPGEPVRHPDPQEIAVEETVAEKFRKQGFQI
jgi:hypothetical protein